jgi:hypothetical protein
MTKLATGTMKGLLKVSLMPLSRIIRGSWLRPLGGSLLSVGLRLRGESKVSGAAVKLLEDDEV